MQLAAAAQCYQSNDVFFLLQVLQTSSPSYLLLSSLDAARRHAAVPSNWSTPLSVAAAARQGLLQLSAHTGSHLLLLQHGCCGSEDSICGFDPLRLVVNVQGLGLSGYAAAEWLENHHDIVPELATAQVGSCNVRTSMLYVLPSSDIVITCSRSCWQPRLLGSLRSRFRHYTEQLAAY